MKRKTKETASSSFQKFVALTTRNKNKDIKENRKSFLNDQRKLVKELL